MQQQPVQYDIIALQISVVDEEIGIAAEILDIADSILYEIQRHRTFFSTRLMFAFTSDTDFIVTSQLLQFVNLL